MLTSRALVAWGSLSTLSPQMSRCDFADVRGEAWKLAFRCWAFTVSQHNASRRNSRDARCLPGFFWNFLMFCNLVLILAQEASLETVFVIWLLTQACCKYEEGLLQTSKTHVSVPLDCFLRESLLQSRNPKWPIHRPH